MFYCGAARLTTAAAACVLPVVPHCGAAHLTTAACALPAMSPSGSCVSCRTVVLPTLPPPLPPVCCLLCCHWVVACCATLWCCPPRHCLHTACCAALWCCPPCRCCLHAACRVAIGQLCVVPRCGAAHLAAAACHVAIGQLHVMLHCGAACVVAATTTCALPVVLLSGSCVSCYAVVLPTWVPLSWRVPLGGACTHNLMSERKRKKKFMTYH